MLQGLLQLSNDEHSALERKRKDFTSSANQKICTDVPGLSVTWSEHRVCHV